MPAQQHLAPITVGEKQSVISSVSSGPNLTVVSNTGGGGYAHTIQNGESLYTIARRYNVTTQAIVQANGLSSPDKIRVGQKVTIPGRPDLGAAASGAVGGGVTAETGPRETGLKVVASKDDSDVTQSPIVMHTRPKGESTAAITDPKVLQSTTEPKGRTEEKVAVIKQETAKQQPVTHQDPGTSGEEKFRWPVSGRVITDFASSKGTGINIEVSEGTAVKATENGTIIYVGNGVEGYGNMVLIRHANGYVSAYAHLKDARVSKGSTVSRGDVIGSAGQSGSVKTPQLHFELRKGATPVDPIPLLAT